MMFEGDEAYEIGDQQLAQAQILWDQRRAIAPSGARLNFDLFEAVRNHAGHGAWSSVKVVITTRPLSSEAQEQHNVLKLDAGFAGLEPYEGMSDLLNPGDWLIDFDFSGRRATSMGVWEAPNAAVVQGDLFYVRRKIGDAIEVSSFGRLLLSAEDQAAIITHAKDIMMHFGSQERGVFCESIEVVVGYFDKLKREAEEASGYKFGPFAAALKRAGVQTNSGRGFWGGRAEDGVPVLTSWLGTREADGTYPVWKPQKNYGGLKSLWESGSIAVGTEVRLILLKPGKGNGDQATVAGAALSEVPWRIASIGDGVTYEARVIPTQS
ncbi:hypothetical protein VW29_04205 [Devosia limi DSM 17137]|nr:hypothetical protein VW29_04205 [Devosia limi DSM 17137]